MTRVLFIDDDVLTLQLMSKVSSVLGFQAIISTSAQRGLSLAVREKPSLVLVDMQMDEMDGSEFVRQLRKLPGLSELPVLIYTVGTGGSDEERAKQAGANALLHKPLSLNDLSRVIQSYAAA